MPEIVLLFKDKQPRQKDEADFAATVPILTPGARAWLRHTLDRVHPGHAWLDAL